MKNLYFINAIVMLSLAVNEAYAYLIVSALFIFAAYIKFWVEGAKQDTSDLYLSISIILAALAIDSVVNYLLMSACFVFFHLLADYKAIKKQEHVDSTFNGLYKTIDRVELALKQKKEDKK